MRLTIERIRTLVLVAAALLLVALGALLIRAKWKNVLNWSDLPRRLDVNVTEESNGYSYSHNLGANSKFKIHAAKAVQLKNDRVQLHDVEIDIYDANGTTTDKIAGNEFEFDQKSGIASAEGPVEMKLTQPTPGNENKVVHPHSTVPEGSQSNQIDVQTSGIRFNRNTGMVTTTQHVAFSMTQGSGSAVGATFDSQRGYLTLAQSVELITHRGNNAVRIHAQHAEFDRNAQVSVLRAATLQYQGSEVNAGQASIQYRANGSVEHLDATEGFSLTTAAGGRIASPAAAMDFSDNSQPRHGHLEGGVTMDSSQRGRTVHAASATADFDFNVDGQLRHAHLEHSVTIASEETSPQAAGQTLDVKRTWRSPVADVNFRDLQTGGKTRVEPETIHGTGGVTLTSESLQGDAVLAPAKMNADEVTGTFSAGSALRKLVGIGHASIEQTAQTGAHQTAKGDRLTVAFAGDGTSGNRPAAEQTGNGAAQFTAAPDVQSAEIDGHVVLVEQQAPKPGAGPQPPMRATAGRAMYEGAGEWVHLTVNPRVVDGGLELAAEKVDVSRQSGDAFAHGNVKVTWANETPAPGSQSVAARPATTLGGNGPAHAIADEARMNESTGEAVFRGHARLWQQANSVAAPEIVLNQHLETLTAHTANAGDPVRAVLLSAGTPKTGGAANTHDHSAKAGAGPQAGSSVIRIRGSDLLYSDPEHRAVMHGGVAGAVVAKTATATSSSDTVDLLLIPAGSAGNETGQAQVDRMTASGHVVLTSDTRRGTGEQLVYSGITGDYVLTGTAAAPPRLTDPDRGSVTGKTLIFHSRDDSVSIEGGSGATRTGTSTQKQHQK